MDELGGLRALSFGARAQQYQRTRPSYPAALLDAVIEPHWTSVADVGAGTGKLTELLCARGLAVTAVEPDAGMRSVLAETAPAATVVAGTGEETGLPDNAVDAVFFAQAWHWVDPARGFGEASRVLRPGGSLVLIWNVRPEVAWVREMDALTASGATVADFAEIPLHASFEAPGRFEVPWSETVSRADLLERASTWSAVATLPETERDAVLGRLRTLLETHHDLGGRDPVVLPQIALAFSYRSLV